MMYWSYLVACNCSSLTRVGLLLSFLPVFVILQCNPFACRIAFSKLSRKMFGSSSSFFRDILWPRWSLGVRFFAEPKVLILPRAWNFPQVQLFSHSVHLSLLTLLAYHLDSATLCANLPIPVCILRADLSSNQQWFLFHLFTGEVSQGCHVWCDTSLTRYNR